MTEQFSDHWASHDLYDRLGLGPEASQLEITRAYRRAARDLHPDLNPEGQAMQFRLVQEAYEVLGRTSTRRRYDVLRATAAASAGKSAGNELEPADQWVYGARMLMQPNLFTAAFRFSPWAYNPWLAFARAS